MPRTRPAYPPEFRHQMVELVRSGRSATELARDFECCTETIRKWVRQADLDEGRRDDGLTSDEREELRRLRRENRQLRLEREILAKAAPGLLGRPARCPQSIRVHESESGPLPHRQGGPFARRLPEWVLRLARPRAVASPAIRCCPQGLHRQHIIIAAVALMERLAFTPNSPPTVSISVASAWPG